MNISTHAQSADTFGVITPEQQQITELHKTIRALCDARPQVIAFALAMEAKLKARDERGVRGWSTAPNTHLLQRLRVEAYELQEQCDLLELESPSAHPAKVLEEAADVANFAMMIADNAGAL